MAQGLRKKKDKSDTRYLEVSDGEGNGDRSVEDGEHRLSQETDISMADFLKMIIRQEDQRKRDRRDKEEREARDREWMERMNEQEERRQLRAEQAAKDKELVETARRKEEADRRREEEERREERLQRDREVLLVQQQEMREANREMHERQSQQHAYDSLLARFAQIQHGDVAYIFPPIVGEPAEGWWSSGKQMADCIGKLSGWTGTGIFLQGGEEV